MILRAVLLVLLITIPVPAQTPSPASANDKSIQDNSFLIEEAYNQESGVVQHISTLLRQRNGDWLYTFTQEWPVFSQKHQFSFTVPVQGSDGDGSGTQGIGDIALNYRYQLAGNGDTPVAVAPRLSLLIPTGDQQKDLGAGGAGIQVNFPVSMEVSKRLVTHWNMGATLTPSAKNGRGQKAGLADYNVGQSIIWLVRPNFNVFLESSWENQETVIGANLTERQSSLLLNPGIRWAHNFRNGLQIVPGIGVPFGVGSSSGERGLFLYLSFEHPFMR